MSPPGGMLPLLKPPGPSSQQVVAFVRRLLPGQGRVGHAGTLDPGAAGVLPVCLGGATRLCDYLHLPPKGYRFELVLGLETDTQDAEGRVLGHRDASGLSRAAVEAALARCVGRITQRVPLYSARRHEGTRLYARARRGEVAPRPEAHVRVERLALLRWEPGHPARALCDVLCSTGTYVRALCTDIGTGLGVGGHMGALVRYAAGGVRAEDCLTLEEWAEAVRAWLAAGRVGEIPGSVSPAAAVGFLPAVHLGAEEAEGLRHGRCPGRRVAADAEGDGLVRLLDAQGSLLAVARRTVAAGVTGFRLEKVLA